MTTSEMTTSPTSAAVPDIPGGPYDLEFFFDPGCPFAWQTSVWVRRVAELRGLAVGWRFISLRFINEDKDLPEGMVRAQERGLRYHRICAAARERLGNDAVGDLYRAFGDRFWYQRIEGDFGTRLSEAGKATEPELILAELGLPEDLLAEAGNDAWDALIRAESEEAFRRTGPDVGTPIITFGEGGNSLFGPVISTVPDDETSLAMYDAIRVLVDLPTFSELKRSARAAFDLPLLAER
jgi:hypothetical protein